MRNDDVNEFDDKEMQIPLVSETEEDYDHVWLSYDDYVDWQEDEDVVAASTLVPLLQDAPLVATSITAAGIALYFAPAPFNARSGRTRRCHERFNQRGSRS
mgnify:CR=1 FL=1|jgi:pre-mRNA-processing factor 8